MSCGRCLKCLLEQMHKNDIAQNSLESLPTKDSIPHDSSVAKEITNTLQSEVVNQDVTKKVKKALSKSKGCKCVHKETKFHHLNVDKITDDKKEQKILQNAIDDFALSEHQKGVRTPVLNQIVSKHSLGETKIFRSTREREKFEDLQIKRENMRKIVQNTSLSVDTKNNFKNSLNAEISLEKAIYKVIVQSAQRSPVNFNKILAMSKSSGSGFLIDSKNRYIVTNGHVVKDAVEIAVESAGNTETQFECVVVKVCFDLDIAIIQVIDKESFDKHGYKALALCRKQPNFIEKVNELTRTHCSTSRFTPVFAVGYPLGSSTFNVTNGIVSGFEGISDEVAIQHTAPISHGSSGGALLNIDGEVIGVTSSGVPDGENIGFAIPVQSVINLWENLRFDIEIAEKMFGKDKPELTESTTSTFTLQNNEQQPKGILNGENSSSDDESSKEDDEEMPPLTQITTTQSNTVTFAPDMNTTTSTVSTPGDAPQIEITDEESVQRQKLKKQYLSRLIVVKLPTFGLTLVKETKDAKIPIFSFNSRIATSSNIDMFATSSSSTNIKVAPSSEPSSTKTTSTTTIVTNSGDTITTRNEQEKNLKQKYTIGKVKFSQKDGQYLFSEANQPGILISRVDMHSVFLKPVNDNAQQVVPFIRLVNLAGFDIDDFGNTGEDTYPRTMPVEFVFRGLKFNSTFSATFSLNGQIFTNQYIYKPLRPEDDFPIRSLYSEELANDEDLRTEFMPFQIGNDGAKMILVRLNLDFIALAGDEVPELQIYKEQDLVKEPLLILLSDENKLIKPFDVIETINHKHVRTIDDLKQFAKVPLLAVLSKKGNISYVINTPEENEQSQQDANVQSLLMKLLAQQQ